MTIARTGATAFAFAWACYAICEAMLVSIIVLGGNSEAGAPIGADPRVGLALLALYPAAGAVLGAIVGLGVGLLANRAAALRALPTLASLSVIGALYFNLWMRVTLGLSGITPLAVLLALAGIALFAAVRGSSADDAADVSAVGHPLVLVPLAVSFAWITRGWLLTGGIGPRLAACGVALTLGLAAAAALRGRRAVTTAPPLRGLAVVAAVGALLLVRAGAHEPAPALPAPPVAGDSPPVVLIVLDTVRADHLGLYGYERETDPHLSAFADRAWVYESALMPSDMTLTSHASIFTGRLVAHHGAVPSSPVLDEEVTTLAEILRDGGYRTYGIASNCGWIKEGNGIAQGFEYWDARCGRSSFSMITPMLLRDRILESLRHGFFPERGRYAWRSAGEITDEALALVDSLPSERAPFFLFLNYMDVHRPIHPPEAYRELFPGRLAAFDMERDWSALHLGWREGRHATAEERAHLISQYDGALRYVDAEVGRFLDRLSESGVLDDALVIITSDHGESFGSHGLFGHGMSVYQDVVHVPLLLKLPGATEGRRVAAPASGVDLLPTVAGVIGLPVPEGIDGLSLLAPSGDDRAIVMESAEGNGLWMRSLLRGSKKLVEREQQLELYDLASDPQETVDLVAAESQLAEELAGRLREIVGVPGAKAPRAPIDAVEAARLRALGYLE